MPRNRKSSSIAIDKRGGSLAQTPQWAAWLEALAAWGGPLILVPGGGAFAKYVRAEPAMGFSDTAAHRMAPRVRRRWAIFIVGCFEATHFAESLSELKAFVARRRSDVTVV